MKKKNIAASLALLFGVFGVHRFYLGKKFLGILHLLLFAFTLAITIEDGVPLIIAPAILGFIDFVLFAVMPTEDFDEKYNKKRLRQRGQSTYDDSFNHHSGKSPATNAQFEEYKTSGIKAFRDYDFEEAICFFEDALNERSDSAAIHFNLACCYSMIEDSSASFSHLENAVHYGFDIVDKIEDHHALAHIRTQPEFDDFVENGYKLETDGLSPIDVKKDDLLTQLTKLGELKDKGILSEEEFVIHKKKLLS